MDAVVGHRPWAFRSGCSGCSFCSKEFSVNGIPSRVREDVYERRFESFHVIGTQGNWPPDKNVKRRSLVIPGVRNDYPKTDEKDPLERRRGD